MKKKQMISKLKFQKTTIVSFKALQSIIGGTLVSEDTTPVTATSFTCKDTLVACRTQDETTCVSCTNGDCTRPTTTANGNTDYCGNGTRKDCLITVDCY